MNSALYTPHVLGVWLVLVKFSWNYPDESNSDKCNNPTFFFFQAISGGGNGVYCVQYDSVKIISGNRDHLIKIWDIATFKLLRTLEGHTGSVLCLQVWCIYVCMHVGLVGRHLFLSWTCS